MKIGIIGAMEEEISQLIKIFQLEKREDREIYGGKVDKKELIVVQSGIGKVNAASITQYLIDTYQPDLIINTGCAGSLKENVKIMDVVLSTYVTYHDFEPDRIMQFSVPENGQIKADHTLLKVAENALHTMENEHYHCAPICSGDCFVTNSEMRNHIYTKTGAYAVDMESASIGHVCKLNKIPFISIRTISDFADGIENFEEIASYKSSHLVKEMIQAL